MSLQKPPNHLKLLQFPNISGNPNYKLKAALLEIHNNYNYLVPFLSDIIEVLENNDLSCYEEQMLYHLITARHFLVVALDIDPDLYDSLLEDLESTFK